MSGYTAKFPSGPKPTFEVTGIVKGGQVVCFDGTTGKVKVAGDGIGANGAFDVVVGVALTNAKPEASDVTTDDFGDPITYIGGKSIYVAVETQGVVRLVNSGSAIEEGVPVMVTASGQVAAAAGAGARMIGYTLTGGATSAVVEVQLTLGMQFIPYVAV